MTSRNIFLLGIVLVLDTCLRCNVCKLVYWYTNAETPPPCIMNMQIRRVRYDLPTRSYHCPLQHYHRYLSGQIAPTNKLYRSKDPIQIQPTTNTMGFLSVASWVSLFTFLFTIVGLLLLILLILGFFLALVLVPVYYLHKFISEVDRRR